MGDMPTARCGSVYVLVGQAVTAGQFAEGAAGHERSPFLEETSPSVRHFWKIPRSLKLYNTKLYNTTAVQVVFWGHWHGQGPGPSRTSSPRHHFCASSSPPWGRGRRCDNIVFRT